MKALAIVFSIVFTVTLAGCASIQNTPQQDYVWAMLKTCDRFATISITRVDQDGRYWARWINSPGEVAPFQECMSQAFKDQPFPEWVKAHRPLSQQAGVVVPISTANLSGTSVSAGASPSASTSTTPHGWVLGDEWSYRWESSRGRGTFVWVVDRFETVDGIEAVVVRAGNREVTYRRADGAAYLERVDGVVELRYTPPVNLVLFPLAVGKTWKPTYTRESPVVRQTEEIRLDCRVESEGPPTVPAGTFRAFHVICLNERSGSLNFEQWYAPDVRNMVKQRTMFSYGLRERELLSYKLRKTGPNQAAVVWGHTAVSSALSAMRMVTYAPTKDLCELWRARDRYNTDKENPWAQIAFGECRQGLAGPQVNASGTRAPAAIFTVRGC